MKIEEKIEKSEESWVKLKIAELNKNKYVMKTECIKRLRYKKNKCYPNRMNNVKKI